MADKKFKVAIVGLGFGAEFIPIYQKHPLGEMYGICRRDTKELHQVGDTFGIGARYTKYEDVLADPQAAAERLRDFLQLPGFDVEAAATQVDGRLHRTRAAPT